MLKKLRLTSFTKEEYPENNCHVYVLKKKFYDLCSIVNIGLFLIVPKELLLMIYLYVFYKKFDINCIKYKYKQNDELFELGKLRCLKYKEIFLKICIISNIPVNFVTSMFTVSKWYYFEWINSSTHFGSFVLHEHCCIILDLKDSSLKQDYIFYIIRREINGFYRVFNDILLYSIKEPNINYILYLLYIFGRNVYKYYGHKDKSYSSVYYTWEEDCKIIENKIKYKFRNFNYNLLKYTFPFNCELNRKDKYLLNLLRDTGNELLTRHVLRSFPNILR